jgi:hypothetical protein
MVDYDNLVSTPLSIYGEISGVDSGIPTRIASYKVPKSRVFWLSKIDVSGDNVSEYAFIVNSITWDKKFSSFFQYSLTFDFYNFGNGFSFSQNTMLEIWVTHNRPTPASFNARIQGMLVGT